MQDSGRWDIQPHAHDGHRLITTDPAGGQRAVLLEPLLHPQRRASRRFAAYSQRVATDVYEVKDDFKAQGLSSNTFAVPFGDHGQSAKDPRVEKFLDELLATPVPRDVHPGRRQRAALHAADRPGVPLRAVHGDDDRRAARLARPARSGDPRRAGGGMSMRLPVVLTLAALLAAGAQPATAAKPAADEGEDHLPRAGPAVAHVRPRCPRDVRRAALEGGGGEARAEGAGRDLSRLPRRPRRRADAPAVDDDQRAHRAHLPADDRRRHRPREVRPAAVSG